VCSRILYYDENKHKNAYKQMEFLVKYRLHYIGVGHASNIYDLQDKYIFGQEYYYHNNYHHVYLTICKNEIVSFLILGEINLMADTRIMAVVNLPNSILLSNTL